MQSVPIKLLLVTFYFAIQLTNALFLALCTPILLPPGFYQLADLAVEFTFEGEHFHGKSLHFIREFGLGSGKDMEGIGFEL